MKLKKSIKILKKHQKRRLGTDYAKPTEPKKLTEAINTILYWLDVKFRNEDREL